MASPRRPGPLAALAGVLAVFVLDAALLALGFGGVAPMVRDPRALALLALWSATNLVLAAWRPVHGQDVTESDRDPLAMVTLLAIPLVTPAVSALGARAALWTLPRANTLSWAGVGLVAAGLAVRAAAMRQLGRRFAPVPALQRGHALETRGLYAFVRHPGYLGALLACLGASVAFGSALALPLPALMLAAQLARVRREEALLARHFGAQWTAYAARTGALLPRIGRAAGRKVG